MDAFILEFVLWDLGMFRLYGASVDTQIPQHNIPGELHTLRFVICFTRDFLTIYGAGKDLHSVCVFSDVDHIEQLLRTNSMRAQESIRKSVRRLRGTLKQFTQVTLSVRYVGTPDG